ncbi:MAG TPA: hypothetical protein VM434_19910 [Beijerinckiaceae bacterium]|nr:hypothetical protein [Beijerinckiaceae bacterium]
MALSRPQPIDHKPFLDMAIGVVFILLVVVAAQMLLATGGASRAPEQRRDLVERQAASLLESVADRLRRRGLPAEIDHPSRSVSVPLAAVVAVGPDGVARALPAAGAAGRIVADRLQCLPGGTPRGADCPALDIRLHGLRAETRVESLPEGARLAKDRYAQLLATVLGAAILQSAPDLLAPVGAGGPGLRTGASALAGSGGSRGLRGDLTFRFAFEGAEEG